MRKGDDFLLKKKNRLVILVFSLTALAFLLKDYVIPGIIYIVQGDCASSLYDYVSALLQFLVFLFCYFVYRRFELRDTGKNDDCFELNCVHKEEKGAKAVECLVLVGIGILCYFAFQFLKNVALLLLFGATRNTIWIPEIVPVSKISLVLIFFVHVVCSAIAEEAFFRATVFSALSRHSLLGGLLYSSLLFAFAHNGIEQVVQAFFLGLVLGVIFERKRSIALCTFVHIIYNTLGLINTYIFTPRYGITSPSLLSMTSIDCYKEAVGISIVAVIAIYSIVVLFGALKGNKKEKQLEGLPIWEKLVAILLLLIYAGKCAFSLLSTL